MSTRRIRRRWVLLGTVVGLAVAAVTASVAATALSLSDDPGVSTGVDPIVIVAPTGADPLAIVTPTDSVQPQPIDDTPLEPSPIPTPDVSTAPDDGEESSGSSIEVEAPAAVIVDDHGDDGPRAGDLDDSGGDTSGGDTSNGSGGGSGDSDSGFDD